ncbi:hypothetical protein J6590_075605 [Homalodisca vitripennis]|nr:hypothetical protein J6590_075605 [Homalodisca vitripennis]
MCMREKVRQRQTPARQNQYSRRALSPPPAGTHSYRHTIAHPMCGVSGINRNGWLVGGTTIVRAYPNIDLVGCTACTEKVIVPKGITCGTYESADRDTMELVPRALIAEQNGTSSESADR